MVASTRFVIAGYMCLALTAPCSGTEVKAYDATFKIDAPTGLVLAPERLHEELARADPPQRRCLRHFVSPEDAQSYQAGQPVELVRVVAFCVLVDDGNRLRVHEDGIAELIAKRKAQRVSEFAAIEKNKGKPTTLVGAGDPKDLALRKGQVEDKGLMAEGSNFVAWRTRMPVEIARAGVKLNFYDSQIAALVVANGVLASVWAREVHEEDKEPQWLLSDAAAWIMAVASSNNVQTRKVRPGGAISSIADLLKARERMNILIWSMIIAVLVLAGFFIGKRRVIDRRRKTQWELDEAEKRRQLEKHAGK